jgi:hypothetical protein
MESMAEDMKPVIIEDKTQRLRDIIEETEKQFEGKVSITSGEAKRIELIRRMKQDTDRKEYMIMFNGLMLLFCLISLIHFAFKGSVVALVFLVIGMVYFIFVRRKLTIATLKLAEYRDNFDRYLWEGYHLKEMRYSAVKLAYFVFFPFLTVFSMDLLTEGRDTGQSWIGFVIAFSISSLGWYIFFLDDKSMLEDIEYDLKSLEYL